MRHHTPYKYHLIFLVTLLIPTLLYAANEQPPAEDQPPEQPPAVRIKRKIIPGKKEPPIYPTVEHPGRDSADEDGS